MHYAVVVRIRERISHLTGDAECLVLRELFLPIQPVAQRFSFDQRHHVIEEARRLSGVV